MADRERITLEQFRARMKDQSVFRREDIAFVCPVCGTVQSMASLCAAGLSPDRAERAIGYDCVGRFTAAGAHKPGMTPGRGCDWTLGGLFHIHELEIEMEDGAPRPCFRLAAPEEAALLAAQFASRREAAGHG